MRKALLVVVLLSVVAPVMATTTIIAVQTGTYTADGTKQAIVTVGYTSDVNVRAFALDINVDSGMNLDNIRDFNRGESKAPGGGYGIFPGRFRDFVNPSNPDPCYALATYNPTAPSGDPGASGTGQDTNKIIVEMGTLYYGDANRPALSGTLFRIDVNSEKGPGPATVTIAGDTMRSGDVNGAVGNDGNTVKTNLPITLVVTFGVNVPNIVGQPKGTADTMITGAGLVVGTKTTQYSDVCNVDIVMTQDPAAGTSVSAGSAVNYKYSLGKFPTPTLLIYPKWDPDCNIPIYWSAVAGATAYQLERSGNSGSTYTSTIYTGTATFKADSNVPNPNYRYRVLAKNADSTSDYKTGTYDCNAYMSNCFPDTNATNLAQWKLAGRPDCWCKASTLQEPNGSGYQCDGDADGAAYGNYRIYNNDLTALSNNWKKTAAQLTNDPNIVMAGKLKITSAHAPTSTTGHTVRIVFTMPT